MPQFLSPEIWIPQSIRRSNADSFRRAKLLVLVSYFLGINSILFCYLNYYQWNQPLSGHLLIVAALLCLVVIPFTLKMTGSLNFAGNLFGLSGLILLLGDAYLSAGGIYAPTMVWLIIPTIVVTMVSGLRSGVFWAGMTSIGITWLYLDSPSTAIEAIQSTKTGASIRPGYEYYIATLAIIAVVLLILYTYEDLHSKDMLRLRGTAKKFKRASEDAKLANNAKSIFIATISHEIRTPLSSILGHLDLLKLKTREPDVLEHIALVEQSATSLKHLLEDVLNFSRSGQTDVKMVIETFNTRELLNEIVEVSSVFAIKRGLEFSGVCHSAVPNHVKGDKQRIRQILLNLINNAIKFTEQGEVKVDADVGRKDGITFRVTDTGIGIAKEELPNLFERFVQIDQGTTRRFDGTGLGLAICKQFTDAMGGTISVESTLGGGSVFTVFLPLIESKATISLTRMSNQAHTTQSMKVLVVDDNDLNREMFVEMLRTLNHAPHSASSADEALHLQMKQTFDIALMDLHMPIRDGAELARWWRKNEAENSLTRTTIIGISADVRPEEQARCEAAGMDDFLHKPFRLKQLSELLSEIAQQ